MPMGSYRLRTSSTNEPSTIRTATGAQTRLEILELHDLAPLRRRIRAENQLQHPDAFDLGVERPPALAQAGDEVDDLQCVSVWLRRAGLLNDRRLTAARLEEQSAPVAPETPVLA